MTSAQQKNRIEEMSAKQILAVLLLMLPARPLHAQTPQVSAAVVIEKGIYSVDAGPPHPATGVRPVRSARLLQATTEIPARLGIIFGMRYVLRGSPVAPAAVEVVTRYPAPGIARPNEGTKLEHRHTVRIRVGAPMYCDFHFGEPDELVPGLWIFEIWHAGRKIGEQKFCVFDGEHARSADFPCTAPGS